MYGRDLRVTEVAPADEMAATALDPEEKTHRFDAAKIEAAGGLEAFEKLTDTELESVLTHASVQSFQSVIIMR